MPEPRLKPLLGESEKYLRLIYDNLTDAVFLLRLEADGKLRCISFNKSALRIFGFDSQWMLDRLVDEILGSQATENLKQRVDAAVNAEGPQRFETTLETRKGKKTLDIVLAPFLDEKGVCSHVLGTACDITPKIMADAKARAMAQRQQTLLDSINDFAWMKDRDGRFVAVNNSLARAVGTTPEEMVGKRGSDYWSMEYEKYFLENDAVVMRLGEPMRCVETFYDERGTKVSRDSIKLPTFDEEGKISGTAGTSRDTSELQKAFLALQKSERRLGEAERIAGIGHWEWNLETGRVERSVGSLKIFGMKPGDIEDDPELFFSLVHPEDRDRVRQIRDTSAQSGASAEYEFRIIRPDGKVRHIHTVIQVSRGIDGKPARMFGINQDITEQRETMLALQASELRLAEAERVGRVGSWEWNFETGIAHRSPGLMEIYGVQPQEMPPQPGGFLEFIHPEDRERIQGYRVAAIEQGLGFEDECRVVRPDGSIRHIRNVAEVFKNAQGKPSTLPSVSAPEEIRVGVDLLDHFMELSGEITVIRNMINKLVRTIEKETAGNRNVAHLGELLEEMHKINGTLQDEVVELRKVALRNVYQPIRRAVRDLGNQLKKDIALELSGENLRVDTSIAAVLSNSLIHMVRNSVDHGIETKGTIRIASRQESEEIVVEISDDGRGIDVEVIRHKTVEKGLRTEPEAAAMGAAQLQAMIFESGFSTAAQVTDVSGRGVGMDMVRKSVLKLGGRIEIASEIGKGSRFTLRLPIPKSVTIVASLLVRAKSEVYAIPQDSIVRLLKFSGTEESVQIRRLEAADCLFLDGKIYPLIELARAFDENAEIRARANVMSRTDGQVVLVRTEESQYGIFVDEILDLEDTVVKKPGGHFEQLHQYAGATFLGDGKVSLILDVSGMAKLNGIRAVTQECQNGAVSSSQIQAITQPRREILLFDIGVPGNYGVELTQVFRLEEFRREEIQITGEQRVVLYRSGIMPLFCLGSLLALKEESIFSGESTAVIHAIVIQWGAKFLGLCVSEVSDLVQTEAAIDFELLDREGIVGGLIIGERAVTLIDPRVILRSSEAIRMLKTARDAMAKEVELAREAA